MATTGHEQEVIDVAGLKASLKKGGNKGIFNEAICSTAGGTAAKVTNTTPASFTLENGATIIVKFTYAISVADATLQVGSAAAKPIYYQGSALAANMVNAGDRLLLRYDGTNYNVIGSLGAIYESKQAASGGTDVSLVTTGEKYAWNQKQDAITFNTAYNASTNKAATMSDITKANVGLSNVTNDAQIPLSQKGSANGVATLDENGHVEAEQLDANYPDLTAGNIVGEFTQEAEFTYRPSAGSVDVKSGYKVDHGGRIMGIKGNTVTWNQLVNPHETGTATDWWIMSSNFDIISGHKYCFMCHNPKGIDYFQVVDSNNRKIVEYQPNATSYSAIYAATTNYINAALRLWSTGDYDFNFSAIDLTLIYGSGNEPATVAEFEADYFRWFGKPLGYEPYDAGSLRPVMMSGIKTVGFNLYNNGTAKVIEGKDYQITGTYTALSLGGETVTPDSDGKFTAATTGELTVTGGGADTCVHFVHSGAMDDEFEEHWESVANVPVTTMTGKLLSDGEPTGNSVVVFPDGLKKAGTVYDEIVKRGSNTYAIKRVGSQSVTGAAGDTVTLTGCDTDATAVVCGIEIGTLSGGVLTLAAAATSVEVYFPLATPEEYLLDDFDLPVLYDVDDWGTEEVVAPTGVASVAPVLDLKYGLNAADTLRNLPRNYVMATMEQSFTDKQKLQARYNMGVGEICPSGTCSTAATTVAKEVQIAHFIPFYGNLVNIKFASAIAVSDATLNISQTGAHPLYYNDVPVQAGLVRAGLTCLIQFDGSRYNILSISGLEQSGSHSDLYVDMGLPSGTLWAKKNIDVTQANGFCASEYQYECSFFSWGNTDGHNPISDSAFDYDFGSSNSGVYASTDGAKLTGNISPSFDAARVNCGAPWRMPTSDDYGELFDNCDFIDANGDTISAEITNKPVTVNSIVGIRLKSKINGNIVFFPCSGYGVGQSWYYRGSGGYYWSRSLSSQTNGRGLIFHSGGVHPQNGSNRFHGFAVRAVQ